MYERWLQQNNFIYFDGLRALSIISVIVFHAAPRFSVENSFTRIGHVGVDLFFVISGFLISSLLIREKRATGRINLRYFYARRALRIFPLYFGLLFFHLFIVYTFIRSRHPLEAQEFIANFKYYLTYTSNWFVSTKPDRRTIFAFAWSLATEEQFYLVWPPVLLILAGSARPLLFALSLLLLTSGLHTFSDSTSQLGWPLLHTIGSSIPPAICLGVIVAVVLHTPFGARLFQFISRKRGV